MSQVVDRVSIGLGDEVAVSSLGATLIAAVVGIGSSCTASIQIWTPCNSGTGSSISVHEDFPDGPRRLEAAKELDANCKLLMAVDADVVPGPIQEWPPFPFALTTKARQGSECT
jgi:hypothetical protein